MTVAYYPLLIAGEEADAAGGSGSMMRPAPRWPPTPMSTTWRSPALPRWGGW